MAATATTAARAPIGPAPPPARAARARRSTLGVAGLALVLLALLTPVSSAASVAELLQTARERLEAGEAAAAVELLLDSEIDHAHRPRYNALLGVAALRAGEYATAVTALRRLTVLRPNDLGARLDLAIAHARLGDASTARRLLTELDARDDVPPGIRRVIRQYLARLDEPEEADWRFSAVLDTRLGHSTNINSGTEVERIELDFEGEPVEIAVAEASRARGDAFALGALSTRWTRPGRWRPEITVRVRRKVHSSASGFDNTIASVGAGITGPTDAADQWSLRGRYLQFDRRAGDTLRIAGLTLEFEHRFGDGLAADAGLDLRRERYRNGEANDGDVGRVRLGVGDRGPHGQWRFELAAGRDEAVGLRAGGDQSTRAAELRLATRLGHGVTLNAGAEWREQVDDAAFSPTLFGATRRETVERRIEAGARWRLGPRVSAVARLSHSDEESNIDLFDQRTTRFALGLQWRLH